MSRVGTESAGVIWCTGLGPAWQSGRTKGRRCCKVLGNLMGHLSGWRLNSGGEGTRARLPSWAVFTLSYLSLLKPSFLVKKMDEQHEEELC